MRFQVIKSKTKKIKGEFEAQSGLDVIDRISKIRGFDRERIYALMDVSEDGRKICRVYKIHAGASVVETNIMEEIALPQCIDCYEKDPISSKAASETFVCI